MDFVREYWPQLIALFMVINIVTVMKIDIDVLKQKVKTLFELWNKEGK
jgi:hypothetical protein